MNSNDDDQVFISILEFLKQSRGFDFTGYKRSSLKRRVLKQMQTHGINTFSDYLDYLQVHPEEFLPLFNSILINVTGFYRDASAWQYLQHQVFPQLFKSVSNNRTIRVWCAGCASGEEAYTLAMILAETLGIEKFREQVKIYATDVDEEALKEARCATYTNKDLQTVTEDKRELFFVAEGNQYIFRPDLRRAIIFGRHDLIQDAPISHLDLLVCRNTLMYFNAETQSKILQRFHFALKNTGILFLGKAEMLLTHSNLFTPINLPYRLFQPVPKALRRERPLSSISAVDEQNNIIESYHRLREAAFDSVPLAQLIVDVNGRLILANQPARAMFGINFLDLGRHLQDLEISYRPIELRSYIEEVYQNHSNMVINDVSRNLRDKSTQYLDVNINLLEDNEGEILGVSITFTDVTRNHDLQTQLQQANQELETANEELQSSNEELETTNEELQSTNEVLETINEEIQSSNEELETMNEELQSTNEELQNINDELRQRTADLNQANAFLNSILASVQAAVVVVDSQFNISTWNEEAENLWGLRAEKVSGRSFFSLDIGLPLEPMREPIRNCLNGKTNRQEIRLQAVDRRGQSAQYRISFNPLISHERERQGVILLMEEVEK